MGFDRNEPSMPRDGSIDAGLLLLEQLTPRGARWTQQEIAIACGCSKGYIWTLEKSAKAKLRRALKRMRAEGRI